MLSPKLLDEISAGLSRLAANSPAKDMEKNARALLGSFLGKLDLVTREEFEVQKEVLARTRSRLEALEARVVELEAQAAAREPGKGLGA